MKIQARLTVLTTSMALIAMGVALGVSSFMVGEALDSAAKEKLSTVLEDRYAAVVRRFEMSRAELEIMSGSHTIKSYLPEFSTGYAKLGKNAQTLLQQNYLKLEAGNKSSLQSQMADTPYGQAISDASGYFSKHLATYDWQNIFLIDPQGNVVFSVLSNTDFGTNLVTGPWKDTGLARAVVPLLHDAVPGVMSFADYSPYAPSHDEAASFLATPLFDEVRHTFLGVMVAQLHKDQINKVTQGVTGMGNTGEVFVIGKDGWMLSDSRLIKEDTTFKKRLDTFASRSVLAGKSGETVAQDYRGVEVLVAYKPLIPFPDALGEKPRWGVIAKIDRDEVMQGYKNLRHALLLLGIVLAVLAFISGYLNARAITRPLLGIRNALGRLAQGEVADVPHRDRHDEIGEMAKAAESFRLMVQQVERSHWIGENVTALVTAVSAETTVEKAADQILHLLCDQLEVPVGAIFLLEEGRYQRVSSHGLARRSQSEDSFAAGDGVLGQCAKDGQAMVLSPVPSGLTVISTGLAEFPPHELVLYPILHKKEVLAVLELAATKSLEPHQHELLKAATGALGLSFANLQAAEHNNLLLKETIRQSEVLQEQQGVLQRSNEELHAMTEELRSQSEEMKAQNEELKASQEELRAQQEEVQHKNQVLESQSAELEELNVEANRKAEDLARANQYKSEFLANMSHELRTPLNSVLILSRNLAENEDSNLTPDQVESATVISESGAQLLTLINDILDLSKIEAGKLELSKEAFPVEDMVTYLRRVFLPQAEKKQIAFVTETDPAVPQNLNTDRQRLTQVLSNLLSNAIKFTDTGEVKLVISKHDDDLLIEVSDSGIGIPADKLEHIFGAFQQVDGTTSRKYGGSGLGLAISRQLVKLLGGDITVDSQPGRGSRFTVHMPNLFGNARQAPAQPSRPPESPAAKDASALMARSDARIMVVEDDARLVTILGKMIKALGFAPVCVESAELALASVAREVPAGIFLDLGLPNMNGMEMLRRLRDDDATANIPVFIMSGAADTGEARTLGALGFLKKPVTRDSISAAIKKMLAGEHYKAQKRVLLIEKNPNDVKLIKKIFINDPLEFVLGKTGAEAWELLQEQRFEAVILDLELPDMTGQEWLKKACGKLNPPPVIVFSGRDLTEAEVFELKEITESIISKGALGDRLREEVLHAVQYVKNAAEPLTHASVELTGKKLLLVDDDARNLFALTKVLRAKGLSIEVAPDGVRALELLSGGEFDAVLTDIMMPGVDGYELIRRIRALGRLDTPIIAITAKAMPGDEELCLQAGANAYLAKPLDIYRLMDILKAQLAR